MSANVQFLNVDLKTLSDEELKRIPVMAAYATNVVIKRQDLSKDDYARILRTWGKNPKRDLWFEDEDNHEVMYVTNKMLKNTDRQGLFARGELEWHCNGAVAMDPEDCVTLYCKQISKDPCNTTFSNGVAAYHDLPQDVKDKIENTYCILSSDDRNFHKLKMDHIIKTKLQPRLLDDRRVYVFGNDAVHPDEHKNLLRTQSRGRGENTQVYQDVMARKEQFNDPKGLWSCVYKPLVQRHRLTGVKGLYLPLLNVVGFHDVPKDEWKDLYEYLKNHYMNYTYSHEWEDGDVVLFDNTQGLHKRDEIPLDENGNPQERELWRGAFWYEGIK